MRVSGELGARYLVADSDLEVEVALIDIGTEEIVAILGDDVEVDDPIVGIVAVDLELAAAKHLAPFLGIGYQFDIQEPAFSAFEDSILEVEEDVSIEGAFVRGGLRF